MPKALESPVMQIAATAPISVAVTNTVDVELPGPGLLLEAAIPSTPGTPQILISTAVPIGETWRIRRVEVISPADALFELEVAGETIKVGRTGPATPTVSLAVEPWEEVVENDTIELSYEQTFGPIVGITARIHYTIAS